MVEPVHPGELIREDVLPAFGLTVTAAAQALNLTRANLSRVLNGQAALTPELALKIEKAFGTSAGLLVNMQANYDLAAARLRIEAITAGVERRAISRPA